MAAPLRQLGGRASRRSADHEFGFEEQFFRINSHILDLVHEQRDRRLAHRFDGLPDSGQRRVGAVHEGGVVIPDHLPILHLNLIGSPAAIWLPSVANAFNIFLLKRFFDSIPTELLAAAAIDGASPLRTLRSVVLPISRPIIGVVSIFSLVAVWKDFLWPLLVEYGYNPSRETLNVGIFEASSTTPQNLVLAASAMAAAPGETCRRTTGGRSSADPPGLRLRPRTVPPASGTCTCSRPSSRTSTEPTPKSARSSRTSCGSGSTAVPTASGSTPPRC